MFKRTSSAVLLLASTLLFGGIIVNAAIADAGKTVRPRGQQSGRVRRLSPWPHQREAIAASLDVLKVPGQDVRAHVIMACGTGKTLVGKEVAEALGSRTLVTEPSLNLLAQTLRVWRANAKHPKTAYLVVCSDETVAARGRDAIALDPRDIPARTTNDPALIAEFLRQSGQPKVLLSTLHSSPLVAEAYRRAKIPAFDTIIVDEAHRTATHEESAFTTVLDQDAVPARGRLFLTATPRIRTGTNGELTYYSMDDEAVYGPRAHHLSFSESIARGLLTDYQLVVAALSRKEASAFIRPELGGEDYRAAIAQLVLMRAAEQYDLSKVVTFHGRVSRAHGLAERLREYGGEYFRGRKVWAQAIDGKMPTAERNRLLKQFGEQAAGTFAVVSNSQCLGEGWDTPALDGVVFFDPKSSDIDVVQAVGRAMRRSPKKKIGTILVPVVVPEGQDPETALSSSAFRSVWQVLNALSAQDERFESRIRALASGEKRPDVDAHEQGIMIDVGALPSAWREALATRVVMKGLGLNRSLLDEEALIAAARAYHAIHARLPNKASGYPVPGMPGDSWGALDKAAQKRLGRTLAKILGPLRKKLELANRVTEQAIIEAGRYSHELHGEVPTRRSSEAVPGMPDKTWAWLDSCGVNGSHGLEKGRTLERIFTPLQVELGLKPPQTISASTIRKAARLLYRLHGRLPAAKTKEPVPGIPTVTWETLDTAGRYGRWELTKGDTLAKVLVPLKKELGLTNTLTKGRIFRAAWLFYRRHGRWPAAHSKEPVPGMPNDRWAAINAGLQNGYRDLKGGETLARILAPFKRRFPPKNALSEQAIIEVARKFYDLHGRLPSLKSKDPVPGMPEESWSKIHGAGRFGCRGLKKGRTLAKILAPLRTDLGL